MSLEKKEEQKKHKILREDRILCGNPVKDGKEKCKEEVPEGSFESKICGHGIAVPYKPFVKENEQRIQRANGDGGDKKPRLFTPEEAADFIRRGIPKPHGQ
jgi:hypothetical protein